MRKSRPSRYPPNFASWDREKQISHMKLIHTREGMIRLLLGMANYETSRTIDSRTRLTKAELAAIVLALDPELQ